MQIAKRVLRQLTIMYPPYVTENGGHQRHNITLKDMRYVTITLMVGGEFWPISLDDEALDKSTAEIVGAIKSALDDSVEFQKALQDE